MVTVSAGETDLRIGILGSTSSSVFIVGAGAVSGSRSPATALNDTTTVQTMLTVMSVAIVLVELGFISVSFF